MSGEPYHLPVDRLQTLHESEADAGRIPLILIACGSFSPVTFLHLRLFEMARDHAHMHTNFKVVGGYLSPVSDEYKKAGLAPGVHRYNMCRLACQKSSDWLMVDPWEALVQAQYSKTADVLDHFEEEINVVRGGIDVTDEEGFVVSKRKARIMLLAGSDLIQTMSEPGVWAEKDLHHILGHYGCFIAERAESEIDQSIFSSSSVHSRSPLALYRDNIFMVSQLVRNDVSSTKVRMFLRKGMSVTYLIPTIVVKYIQRNGLYSSKFYNGELGSQSQNSANSSSVSLSKNASSASLPARGSETVVQRLPEDDASGDEDTGDSLESLAAMQAEHRQIAETLERRAELEAAFSEGKTCN